MPPQNDGAALALKLHFATVAASGDDFYRSDFVSPRFLFAGNR